MPEQYMHLASLVINILGRQMVYSSILFVMIFSLSFIIKQRWPFLNYALWALVLLRLVLPPDLSAPWSARTVMHNFSNRADTAQSAQPMGMEDEQTPFQHNHTPAIRQQFRISVTGILFMLWLSGLVFFAGIYLYNRGKYHRIVNNATPIKDHALLQRLAYWRRYYGIKRSIRLLSSDRIHSPFTMGLFRPVICLPANLQSGHENTEPIIAHECAHIKRLDDLQITLQSIMQMVYFFNPVVWFANTHLNRNRELLCDQMVLTDPSIKPVIYLKSLLHIMKQRSTGACSLALLPEFGRDSQFIINRVHTISRGRLMKTNKTLAGIIVLLLGITILPMAIYTPVTFAKAPAAAQAADEMPVKSNIDFVCPIKTGKITVGFEEMVDPFSKEKRFHNGIDIKAPKSTHVYAAAAGKVSKVVNEYTINKGRGRYLVIQHADGMSTLYSHLNKIAVSVGETVNTGDLIAHVGTTGRSTGPHLHFELMKDEKCIDPAALIDFDLASANQ